MIKASIEYRLLRVERRRLFQHTYTNVTTVDDVAAVVALMARQDAEQRRLARTVLGNESHVLPFSHREVDVLKQYQRTERLRQVLNVQIGGVLSHSSAIG